MTLTVNKTKSCTPYHQGNAKNGLNKQNKKDDDDDDCFCIVLFSALKQTHRTRMWFYMSEQLFIAHF